MVELQLYSGVSTWIKSSLIEFHSRMKVHVTFCMYI